MKANLILFTKASGWWSPQHGGTHVKRGPVEGDGGAGDAPLLELPSSDHIQSIDDARAYWRAHLAGKTMELAVRKKGKEHKLSVTFRAANSHAFTRAAAPGETPDLYDSRAHKRGPRVFDASRARYIDQILPSLQRPKDVLGSFGREVYLGSPMPGGQVYVVVLSVTQPGQCEFVTSQPRSRDAVAALRRQLRAKVPGALLKAVFPTTNEAPAIGPGAYSATCQRWGETQPRTPKRPLVSTHRFAAGTRLNIGQAADESKRPAMIKAIDAGARVLFLADRI